VTAPGRVPPAHAEDDDDALSPGIRRVDDDGSMFAPLGDDDGHVTEESPAKVGGAPLPISDESASDLDIGLDGAAGGNDEGGAWTDAVGEHEDDALLDGVDEPADGEGWTGGASDALLEEALEDAAAEWGGHEQGGGEQERGPFVSPRGTDLEGPDDDPGDAIRPGAGRSDDDDSDDDALPSHLKRVSERPPGGPNLDEDEPFTEDSEP
jgi:hypothetical protein